MLEGPHPAAPGPVLGAPGPEARKRRAASAASMLAVCAEAQQAACDTVPSVGHVQACVDIAAGFFPA